MTELIKRLFSMREESYRAFQSALIPTVEKERVIGVRVPGLRRLAKQIKGTELAARFLESLPHTYYEEDLLHGFLIEQITDLAKVVQALEAYLPYVDNWATCDCLSPRIFREHREKLLPYVQKWTASEYPYVCRFGIGMLMKHYLTDAYDESYPRTVASIQSEHYYVRMMVAWYFATALSVRFEEILPYLEEGSLSPWVRGKAIQKALESHRISSEQKRSLRVLREKIKKSGRKA